jgi:hypothetical protein
MKKPNEVLPGQIWMYQEYPHDYDVKVESVGGTWVTCVIVASRSHTRPIGMIREFYASTMLEDHTFSFANNLVTVKSRRNRPKLSIVDCRGCGKQKPWIKGTSKKNYLCMPCRDL